MRSPDSSAHSIHAVVGQHSCCPFLLLLLLLLLPPAPATAFTTNGHQWPALPIQVALNPEGCPVLADGSTMEDILLAALATWEAVPCSAVTFEYLGETDATWAADDLNTIFCAPQGEDWPFSPGAAGATLWIPTGEDGLQEVDLALNAAELVWRKGGGNALEDKVIDPQAVLTHELGHWLGLSHSADPYATMYYAMLPFGVQATLEADDRAGACALYPVAEVSECATAEDCGPNFDCVAVEGAPGNHCQDRHSPPGTACNKDFIDCADMCWVSLTECSQVCLFQNLDYSEGYCAPLCGQDKPPCPAGFACQAAGGGVEVCQGKNPDPQEDVVDEELTISDDILEETSDDLDGGDTEDPAEDTVDDLAVPDQVLTDSATVDASPQPPDRKQGSSGGCATLPLATPAAGLGFLALMLLLTLGVLRKLV